MSNVYAVNKTGSLKTVSSWTVYYINSTNAGLVTVYDSNNNPYDCFKYILHNIEYYYVIDGIQNIWTDDLSSIGYHLNPIIDLGELIFVDDSTGRVIHSISDLTTLEWSNTGYYVIDSNEDIIFVVTLPTVSVTGDFGTNNWLYRTSGGIVMSIDANSQENLWNATGSGYVNVSYDTSKAYAVILWYSGTGSGDRGQNGVLSIVNNSGDIAAKNNTSSSVNLYALRCAICSDSSANVVIVYDSSNNAYNAFKYITNSIDYYYVLDGTQTDWTDDLTSIGYSLTPPVVFPTVTFSDEISSGTISALTLPTAHSGYYTDAKFDSLRYYVKGTVSDPEYFYGLYGISSPWYGGKITWFDSSIGDLSDKLFTTGTPSVSTTPVKQTILRVFLITNNGISGYPVQDTIYDVNIGQISNYTYNNGQHSITLWFSNIGGDWTTFAGAGRLMLRYLDDTTAFYNLDSFDLFNVSSGALSKATTTERYDMYNTWNSSITLNARYASCSEQGVTTVTVYDSQNVTYTAFKYTTNNTVYYYVLDGTQTDWTDDLASIGYHIQIDIWFALSATQGNQTFGRNDYWGSFIIDSNDKAILQNFGVAINQVTVDSSTYDVVSFDNLSFSFDPIGLYAGIRTDPRTGVNINNFRCERGPDGNAVYYPQICIWSTDAYNVTCKTWLCRITKNS